MEGVIRWDGLGAESARAWQMTPTPRTTGGASEQDGKREEEREKREGGREGEERLGGK